MNEEAKEVAACCAQFYEQDWVQTILGKSFHPGGVDLTKRLIRSLNIQQGDSALDVACGIGTTTVLVDQDFGANAVGVDFSETNIQKATQTASESGATVRFETGDVTALPVGDSEFDHLICECAVSTFVDQPAALAEFYRVIKSGGQVAISDMVLNEKLPETLELLLAPWTCLASARSAAGYQQLFIDAGFVVTSYEDESQSLLDLIFDLKKKLLVAGLGKTLATADGVPDVLASLDISEMKTLLDEARTLVNDGVVQYCRMTFAKDKPKMAPKVKETAKETGIQINQIQQQCGPGCDC